ncbi:MAG: hypothetical protein KDA25_00535 [Phycisphaerales bacterium]|nr:hypothetical protein [Phycisphaerales bacterium]
MGHQPHLVSVVGALLALAGPMPGDEQIVPPWFVHPAGTHQGWDFSDLAERPPPEPPYPPDAGVINPFGRPAMTIGGDGATGVASYQGRPTCWNLVPGSTMTFTIPNVGIPAPTITWLQITYWSSVDTRPRIALTGSSEIASWDVPVGPPGSGWRWNGSIHVSEFCLPLLIASLMPAPDDAPYIDRAVIDTICVFDDDPPAGDRATPEPEPCGDDVNGGCDDLPTQFELVTPGTPISGTAWAAAGRRDTDWYEVVIDEPAHLHWAASTRFPATLRILDDACPPNVLAVAHTNVGPVGGHGATFAPDLPPGTYRLFIAPGSSAGPILDGLPCDAGMNDYAASVSVLPSLIAPPPNDACDEPVDIVAGATAFTTLDADTDGLPHTSCQFDGQTYHDIWFRYVATCDGTLTLSTCNDAAYDTDLVVYAPDAPCPPDDAFVLGCNDDAPGCAGFTSEVTVPVECDAAYLLRVGGWGATDQGEGVLTLTCTGEACTGCPCAWDLDGDCVVGPADLAILLANWGRPYDAGDLGELLADLGCAG